MKKSKTTEVDEEVKETAELSAKKKAEKAQVKFKGPPTTF